MFCGEHGTIDYCPECVSDEANEITVKQAMDVIKKAMRDDNPGELGSYAHAWHCNIAMMCYDAIEHQRMMNEGGYIHAHNAGNDAASRFMKLCFDVETKNN
jgi:pyrrolidone-carboxylate peptidase